MSSSARIGSETTCTARTVGRAPWLRSRDHAAFKHLVRDRRRHSIDEHTAHLWIVTQKIYGFLFSLRFQLPSLLPQLLARGILVLLDDLVGGLVQQRVLGVAYAREQQHGKQQRELVKAFTHGFPTPLLLEHQVHSLQFRFQIPHYLPPGPFPFDLNHRP